MLPLTIIGDGEQARRLRVLHPGAQETFGMSIVLDFTDLEDSLVAPEQTNAKTSLAVPPPHYDLSRGLAEFAVAQQASALSRPNLPAL
jgi:hypothetical protein